jgi:hypothetical protein
MKRFQDAGEAAPRNEEEGTSQAAVPSVMYALAARSRSKRVSLGKSCAASVAAWAMPKAPGSGSAA